MEYIAGQGCGWWIDCEIDKLAGTLKEFENLDVSFKRRMSESASSWLKTRIILTLFQTICIDAMGHYCSNKNFAMEKYVDQIFTN